MPRSKKKVYDDICIPSSHWIYLLEGVRYESLRTNILYMMRIYVKNIDKYYYKVGFTDNVKKRIKDLENEYNCVGRIVPVFLCRCEAKTSEQLLHDILHNYKEDDVITNNVKHDELYKISLESYNRIKEGMIMLKVDDNEYISNRYNINDNCEIFDGELMSQDENEAERWREFIHGEYPSE